MRKLYVPLREPELTALKSLAARERRRPQDQAAVLLTTALARTVDRSPTSDWLDPEVSTIVDGGPTDAAA